MQIRAFAKAKTQLTSTCILTHFDLDTIKRCIAERIRMGVGWPDGSERPITFFSRSLAPADKKYSVPDRERESGDYLRSKKIPIG